MNPIEIHLSRFDLHALGHVIILVLFGLLVLLMDLFQKPRTSRSYLANISILGLLLAAMWAYLLWNQRQTIALFGRLIYQDGFTQALTTILILGGVLACLLARDWMRRQELDHGEFYALLLFSTAGMILMISAADLLILFLGLETFSIAAYVMAGYQRSSKQSAEAATKYLILGLISSAILVYGIALIYGVTGSTNLHTIGQTLAADPALVTRDAEGNLSGLRLLPMAAMILILVAFGFKVALAPFHMWVPDVYEGSPTPSVVFMSTAVKAASIAALIRLLVTAFFEWPARISAQGWVPILLVLILLTIIVGNLGAIVQNRLKRMLAYSSIAHAGYLLLPLLAAGTLGGGTTWANSTPPHLLVLGPIPFYLVAYTLATAGAFGIIAILEQRQSSLTFDDINGLGRKHPWLGFSLTIFMLSAAGIPPTAGFLAKFLAFRSLLQAAAWSERSASLLVALAIIAILASVASFYYYLKVVVHLYMRQPGPEQLTPSNSPAATLAIVICVVGTCYLGVLPHRLSYLSFSAVANMADTSGGPASLTPPTRQRPTTLTDNTISEGRFPTLAFELRYPEAPKPAAAHDTQRPLLLNSTPSLAVDHPSLPRHNTNLEPAE